MPNEAQLPVAVVADLLALARSIYAAVKAMGPGHDAQLLKLEGIGYQLRLALDKAAAGAPGTFAHRSAWLIAEKAAADLGAAIDVYLPARALVTATRKRLSRRR